MQCPACEECRRQSLRFEETRRDEQPRRDRPQPPATALAPAQGLADHVRPTVARRTEARFLRAGSMRARAARVMGPKASATATALGSAHRQHARLLLCPRYQYEWNSNRFESSSRIPKERNGPASGTCRSCRIVAQINDATGAKKRSRQASDETPRRRYKRCRARAADIRSDWRTKLRHRFFHVSHSVNTIASTVSTDPT